MFAVHRVIEGQNLHQARQHERIDRRIRQVGVHPFELGVVGAGIGRRRDEPVVVVLFEEINAEGADELGGEAAALGEIAAHLRGIHRLLRAHVAKAEPVVADHQDDDDQAHKQPPHSPAAAFAFQLVNHILH